MPNTIPIIYRYRVPASCSINLSGCQYARFSRRCKMKCKNHRVWIKRVYETPIHFRPYTSYISRRRLENPFPTISFDIANRMVSRLYGKFAELEKIAARSEYVDFIKRDKSTQATSDENSSDNYFILFYFIPFSVNFLEKKRFINFYNYITFSFCIVFSK